MTTATHAEQLRGRIRKYFFVVVGLIIGAFVFIIALATTVKLAGLEDKTAATIVGVASMGVMLGVVASSWIAVAKYWRCPACEKSIYWAVSWNLSLFAGSASPNCPSCGVELFTQKARKRAFRLLLILIGLGAAAGVVASVLSNSDAAKKKQQQVEMPKPPG